MRILPFSVQALEEALSIIRSGGVVAHATETCYGLACDLRNVEAVKKLFAIKQRSHEQPVSGLFTSTNEAKNYVEWSDRAEKLAIKHLPGPLTLILPMRPDSPSRLYPALPDTTKNQELKTTNSPTLGIRVSSHPHAISMAEGADFPLSTTSANIHGQSNPYSTEDIVSQFKDKEFTPDLILDGGLLPQNPPSTVMDLTTENIEFRRSGHITDDLEANS